MYNTDSQALKIRSKHKTVLSSLEGGGGGGGGGGKGGEVEECSHA